MKIVKTLIIAMLAFLLIACSGFNNPISNGSGGYENGSGGYENG